jgi:hypothetical protein
LAVFEGVERKLVSFKFILEIARHSNSKFAITKNYYFGAFNCLQDKRQIKGSHKAVFEGVETLVFLLDFTKTAMCLNICI